MTAKEVRTKILNWYAATICEKEAMKDNSAVLIFYGGLEPISETVLGRVTHWKPTGYVAFKRSNGVITERPFRFGDPALVRMSARCFGLAIDRLFWTQPSIILQMAGIIARSGWFKKPALRRL